MFKKYEISTNGPIAHDLFTLFESGELDLVESLTVDNDPLFDNQPAGLDPTIILAITFVVQVGANITSEFIVKYLSNKLKYGDSDSKIHVKEYENESH